VSRIAVGIGGWTYEPWRGTFFPPGLPRARELAYVGERLTATEVNGTYYSRFKPETFAGWAKAVPDGFVFALKASRFCTTRKVLAEAGESVARFVDQGLVELGDRLGPILWQFMPTRRFDPDDLSAFLALLPRAHAGVPLRHAVQPRHDSFADPAFVALMREAGVAIAYGHSADYPGIADVTADFVYARLESATEAEPDGYPAAALDGWAAAARTWAAGGAPADLPYASAEAAPDRPRDTFVFAINGFKPKAPAAAIALLERLGR
jgi:uncharacterized protein YecE (DUF72 family)